MNVIAFQGEAGAYSERAAKEFFRDQAIMTLPCRSFGETFAAVRDGKATAAAVPIENSLAGSVHQNYDLLLRHKLSIVAEIKLRIQLHLMALPKVPLNNITSVYSHPQALGQCEEYLRSLKGVHVVAY